MTVQPMSDQAIDAHIPFNRACLTGNEHAYIADALASGDLAGDGPYTARCHRLLEATLGVPKALLTTSCTHALEMSALLLDIQPGDEIIVPSFAFVTTINAFALRGAAPVFVDIRPDTLNMDEQQVEERITARTKAIVPIHYAGVGCEMETILAIARRHGVAIVEDNAHGLFGMYRGRFLGTFGDLAAQSFHATKNFTCGEGGALLINDARYAMRAEIIRDKGTDRTQFLRGAVDYYTWRDIGSSYLPADLLAAFLLAQLEARDRVLAQRRAIWERYDRQLRDWAAARDIQSPVVPPHCVQSYAMYYLLLPSAAYRQALTAHLQRADIQAVSHYLPLDRSPMGQRYGGPGAYTVSEHVSERLLRLPFFNDLTADEQERVIAAVVAFDT